ncbi:putative secreted protein [Rhodopirellula maiorica SM1]|uniref:Putative secreted protein n=1 Tax=Rhodopirellula maiorica SM1 TaxID=1265738 RepID=M5RJY3_9BACT|nr:hypothetical protein [Rhodopirellula maiorica]EMI19620.1 putative secreted protein [Rhodopirellula maiorica SM1]
MIAGLVATSAASTAIAQDAPPSTEHQDDASRQATSVSSASPSPTASDGEQLDLNLQLDWAAETAHRWNVEVEIIDSAARQSSENSTISELRNLCSDPATCGLMHRSDKETGWHFHSSLAMTSGAAAFRVHAAKTAEIVITINATPNDATPATEASDSAESPSTTQSPSPSVTRIPITQLLSDSQSASTGDDGPRWTLQRTKDDSLRVWIDPADGVSPSGMICEPNSEMSLYVRGNAADVPGDGDLRLHSSMIRVADNHVVATKTTPISLDADGNSEPILFQHTTPADAGVYEVRFELEHNQNPLWSRWRRHNAPLARANHVFTVLPKPTSHHGEIDFDTWHTVSKIKPSEGSQWTVPTLFNTHNNPLIPSSLIKQDRTRTNTIDAGQKITIIPGGKTFESSLAKLRPDHPHYVTVRYPANRDIHVQIELTNDGAANVPSTHYVLLDEKRAADRYRDDQNQWRSQSFLYYPHGNDQLRLTNLDVDQDAAIESIEIKVGPQNFAVNRPTAQAIPPSRSRMSTLNVQDFDWPDRLAGDEAQRLAKSDFSSTAISLHQLFVATERLQEYASVLGVNSICISANDGGKTLFPSSQFLPTPASRVAPDHKHQTQWLDLILSLMDRSDFQVVVGIHPTMTMRHVETHAKHQRIRAPLSHYTLIDPVTQQALYAWIQELLQHTTAHSCFAGVAIPCSASHHTAAYDPAHPPSEAVLRQFAIAVGKPDATTSEVQHWIHQDKHASLQKWAIQSNRNFYTSVSHLLGSKLCLLTELSPTHLSSEAGISLVDMTWPPVQSNLVPMTAHPHEGWTTLAQQIEDQQNADHYVAQLQPITGRVGLNITSHRFASVPPAGSANETAASTPPVVSHATIIDRSIAPHLSQLIDRLDPRVVMVDHISVGGSFPQNLRPVLLAYNAAPSRAMKEFGSPDATSQIVQVRWGMENQHLVLSLTNHAPWPCEVDVISKKPIRWNEVGQASDATRHTADMLKCTVPLNAGQLKVIRSEQPQSSEVLSTWVSRVHGDSQTIEKIKSDVTIVVERLGMLADSEPYAVLSNPGFEVVGGIGITGWMHAQYPEGAVRIDEHEAIEGERSLCLTTVNAMATKTWLVSETIPPPKTGRLAVSLAVRSEASEVTTPHRIRVSVEGTQAGSSFRHSEEVDVPRNGTWQPRKVLVEADKIDPMTMDSLRITIDSLSPGKLWIDDVHLHDFFPMNKERAELQSQAFLAVQGLQRGNLAPSARLLKNRWAQFLLNDTRVRPTPVIKEETDEVAPPTGVAERIKGWLPKPIRF